jgi:hypothetical protein
MFLKLLKLLHLTSAPHYAYTSIMNIFADAEEYFSNVPVHMPFHFVNAVIGEVLWTQMDSADMMPFCEKSWTKF